MQQMRALQIQQQQAQRQAQQIRAQQQVQQTVSRQPRGQQGQQSRESKGDGLTEVDYLSNYCCCVCIHSGQSGIVTKWGRFSHTVTAGLTMLLWPCEKLEARVSLRLKQVNVPCDTKTKDDVTIHVSVAIQYQVVDAEGGRKAYYSLSDVKNQMRAYVEDSVRSSIPKMLIDEVFEARDAIANDVKEDLSATFTEYGIEIVDVLITDMKMDQKVQVAMNDVNASSRIKQATIFKAEADKTLVVVGAEAGAESAYLQGVGLSRERKAMVDGLHESVSDFTANIDVQPAEVLNLLMSTQYMDSLKEIGQANQNSSILVIGNQGGLQERMRKRMAQKKSSSEAGSAAERAGLVGASLI
jgi:regulator of protease activity HflC (stomatin/prohibitin superfamily)